MRVASIRRGLLPLLGLGLAAAGCSSEAPPPLVDSGAPLDGDVPETGGRFTDSDGDGLCDSRERVDGTDPFSDDTDGDGLVDLAEFNASFDGTDPMSPRPERVALLPEGPASSISVVPTVMVFANGLDYSGAVEALPAPGDLAQLTARDFLEGTAALSASPEENVAVVDAAAARFLGVNGSVELAFEVRFAYGSAIPRPCARAYPFRYNTKRSDGATVSSARFLLVVLPPGSTLGAVDWCMPDGDCIE